MKRRKKRREIRVPSRLMIGDQEYRVLWCSDLNKGVYGLCTSGEPRVIVLNSSQERSELLPTLVHEALHAIEHEAKLDLGHKRIAKLEYALAQLIEQLLG